MDSVWTSLRVDWQSRALCVTNHADPDLFSPTVETNAGVLRVSRDWCDHCPVKAQCLNSALINNDSGYRGGTNTDQRRALRRTRSRVKCPLCAGGNVVLTEAHEVCINCGASWKIDARPETRVKKKRYTPTSRVTDVPLTGEAASCL